MGSKREIKIIKETKVTPRERIHFFLYHPKGRMATFCLSIVFTASFGLDQLSKYHAHRVLLKYENPDHILDFRQAPFPIGTIGNRNTSENDSHFIGLQFRYARNPGAAFSLFADWDEKIREPFFNVMTLLAIGMIIFYLYDTPIHFKSTRLGLVMILAGAFGNLVDRLRLSYVIDFIDVDWQILGWRHDFAIFNVADVSINIGVGLFILDYFFHRNKLVPNKNEENTA